MQARKSVITESLANQIIVRLESKHSPEQISGGLALTGQRVSTSTIYRHLREDKKAGGQLHLNLRINGHRRYWTCHHFSECFMKRFSMFFRRLFQQLKG